MRTETEGKIREPIVEGLFYPETENELKESIRKYSAEADGKPGNSKAITTPHGSYDRCGEIIAAAFKAAAGGRIERIVLIGPVHREESDAVILPESSAYRIPLGNVEVDEESVAGLSSCGTRFVRNDIPHLEEHCLEVQLPFVKTLFPKAKIIPVLLGKTTMANVKSLSQGLYVVFGEKAETTLYAATTNFSFSPNDRAEKPELDVVLDLAAAGDWEALVAAKAEKRFQSCGLGCLAALAALSLGTLRLLARKAPPHEDGALKGVEYAALAAQ